MNQLRFISQTIYKLKKQYGVPFQIYTTTSSSTDLQTGVKSVQKRIYNIKYGIVLPRKMYAELVSLLGGSRTLSHNNLIDKETRVVLLDAKDYPADYVIEPGDYVLMNHERFNITEINLYDHRLAGELKMTKIIGEKPRAIIEQSLKTKININQGLSDG